ncbi:MFS general substrate transporter [Aureobasidium subglaciale]|uniref:Major facilitator superfamily (MFS) profile domain-containing protein n=1 Tax=Aureobasidium subglaciale (strain EXF-2481) TaxID=1043005 RepID=A0A074ZFT4_AURSE|nr:uncharacterized protein AUEXF2481DRAFT_87226 [Aureobasidium subglaciale EXF-2481]KAI5197795.1 MFS general substrate transporter [Aureobasidium subglaciale]KAI5216629.1 MFS general substrate transporter [Aureobasidium subglaciale]KAI5219963.1 MFS general substrate transporter [Aureobasidium subglaciale]KAI5235889.1 MFS general substrate transporter [Aureobasidium subglaciale]KAI5257809.1 MFS general substrate transporter [Aureobasidium subglaciale]
MSLPQRQRRDYNKFPTTQLFFLALVRVAEPIALTSIFPYAWKLVIDFNVTDRANASFYAGLLISAFALAESLTGLYWGGLSDRIGRKPVLLLGSAGTMLSLLLVGVSTNFWMALAGRAIGGFLNGNIGVIQTMVGELTVNPKHEPRAYSVMPFVWSIGTIIGPSIGGIFSAPADNFPDVFSPHGIFAKFPYLLPNLICAALMMFSIVCGFFFLEETHPDMQPWSTVDDLQHTEAETPLFAAQAGTTTAAVDLRNESYGTFNKVVQDQEWNVLPDGTDAPKEAEPQDQVVFTKRVVMLIIALGIFTYHSMSYDHLLPIFFQDSRVESRAHGNKLSSMAGGLGLTIQDVGVVMSVNGIIALGVQAIIFPLAAAWLGVWKLFIVTTVLHPLAYVVVPYLVLLPDGWLYPGIYACLTIRNIFAILVYPVLLILLKEASPSPSCLGKINGLAASTGAACRTLASPIAGILYGIGIDIDFTALAWWVSGAVAIIGAIQCFFVHRNKSSEWHQVRARAPCRFMPPEEHRQDIVHIVVQDEEEEGAEANEQQRLLA